MQTRRCLTVCLLLTLVGAACKGKRTGIGGQGTQRMLSTLAMSDPNAEPQLLSGFYAVESRAWRWTAGAFSVQLRTPPGAGQRGATLTVALTISDVVIGKLTDNQLTASINGTTLQSQKYDMPGSYFFSADIPPSMLTADSIKVDFIVDKTMRVDGDKRDLGFIVKSVSIDSK
ncbi:MAG TPA: hypothetical protein VGL82_09390 [Bryobacteraceae bacterium]